MKDELCEYYPHARNRPVYVVGAPQFDVFFQKEIRKDRRTFCNSVGLKPEVPIVLYALGSPNFLKEHYGAIALAERIQSGELGDVQLLVRPHPVFDNGEEAREFERFGDRVRVQRTGLAGSPTAGRSQTLPDIVEWVNTFYHADVVVNLSSTATVDAAICDRPIVNLDYDPEPGQPNRELVKDVNHLWTHFKPIVESGGVSLAASLDETVDAIRLYLSNPALHAERRRWIAEYVCGFVDGRCGERLAEAMLDFVNRRGFPELVR
jgi:CDP-glycerol glycerophosphotransferase (TagB/SpsB family)